MILAHHVLCAHLSSLSAIISKFICCVFTECYYPEDHVLCVHYLHVHVLCVHCMFNVCLLCVY